MKLSVKLLTDIMSTLTLSSKSPVKDLEDRWSLDRIPDVGS